MLRPHLGLANPNAHLGRVEALLRQRSRPLLFALSIMFSHFWSERSREKACSRTRSAVVSHCPAARIASLAARPPEVQSSTPGPSGLSVP